MSALLRNFLGLLLLAAACLPLAAQAQSWESLNTQQKEALGPLSSTWNSLPEKQQTHFLAIAKHYPKLTPQKQQLLHSRMETWSKLTPEQRNRAREKIQGFQQGTCGTTRSREEDGQGTASQSGSQRNCACKRRVALALRSPGNSAFPGNSYHQRYAIHYKLTLV